jgi:hypothetical protein
MAIDANITITNTAYGNGIKTTLEEMMYSSFTFQYIPESISDGVGSITSSVQTELQTALAIMKHLNVLMRMKLKD